MNHDARPSFYAWLLVRRAAPAPCLLDQQGGSGARPPPPTVAGRPGHARDRCDVASEWITTLDGQANAQVRPQVSGYLVRRDYQEGARVRKGDVLFEIDERPFAVALAQAEARLAEARAQLGRAEQDVARNTPLAKERAIAQSELDNNVQAKLAAEASVNAAQAAVDAARLNLELHSRALAGRRHRRRSRRHRSATSSARRRC